ncbi:hypothetical protein HPB50_005738 [Hyalomma asiaticum]|uniref:Uncharacterized protein n=1 Tax=Hyalomma asiaticum TaxID=266040 RepID=A0ACB7SRW4_HYAAI|nr:hypothetical protein HPB50_005738 [Hyalomma asiaticum]
MALFPFLTAGYVYQPPKRGKPAEPAVREPPRPVLLTVEDCGKLALEAVREYVERHPIERDDSAEITREEAEDKAATRQVLNPEENALSFLHSCSPTHGKMYLSGWAQ